MQILQLFDSLMRLYPISSFLFWELKPENRSNWEIYKFIDHLDERNRHNSSASTAGVQHLNLVLDGQQRLTSLLIGLKGVYTARRKNQRWNNPNAFSRQQLYLDLLKNSAEAADADTGLHYGFAFFERAPQNTNDSHWFKVSKILDFDSKDRFDGFVESERESLPESATKRQESLLEQNLQRLYKAVWENESISYYTEHDQDYDRVLDIFVRANDGGTKLSKSDLLLSMVTSRWSGRNARQEIYDFVDHLNNNLTGKNDFNKDFVLKACLVLTDLQITYKVTSFTNTNLDLIQSKWDRIKTAIETAVDLANSFGIERDALTSQNALTPICYYLFNNPGKTLRSGSLHDAKNASLIRRWLVSMLFNNVFGALSDTTLRESRRVLQEQQQRRNSDFPAAEINLALAESGKSPDFDNYALERYLATEYNSRTSALALSLLYDDNNWGMLAYHQDHIFPRTLFKKQNMDAAGLSAAKQEQYQQLYNRVGNLELLLNTENLEKSNKDFADWLTTRDASFRKRHLIPDDDDLLKFERFEDFIKAREALIKDRLQRILSL